MPPSTIISLIECTVQKLSGNHWLGGLGRLRQVLEKWPMIKYINEDIYRLWQTRKKKKTEGKE